MSTFTLRSAAILCALSLPVLTLAGCGAVSAEVSAMTKIATGHMDTLTGQEVQAVAAYFVTGVELNDQQADAIAQFLADNDVATMADLQALIEKARQDPDSVQLPDDFLELFQNFQLPGAEQPD
jgi:hypothetical protein